ncbi:uncharacterized protein LOC119573965 [Penaeus monodon]|uniref:Uncharacterized protein n=2 Tax=Penaeus TaxID=133894 RepID=A0A3R7PFG9_PENVA|nr:uncharacterized protein LOC119573965 [Penaeus monodon]ROT85401.1 hypothetical protein C7M84_015020 [Penaeus vannamei]
MSLERAGPSSRYVDYTQSSHSGYRPSSVSSYEYPPERPPRRERDRRERSRSRDSSRERYPGGRGVYYNPGIEEDRAPSDRAESEFTVRNEAVINPQLDEEERRAASRAASEIYASTRMPRPQSEIR